MPTPCRRSIAHATRAVLLCAALAACSSKESGTAQHASSDSHPLVLPKIDSSATAMGVGTSQHRYGPPTGKIRVANLFQIGGKPFGPVDLYDVMHPDSATKPLIANLGYGQISAYVSPRAGDNYQGSTSNLYLFPAGQKTASRPFGFNVENTGYLTADQVTVVLGPSSTPQAISSSDVSEEGLRIPQAQQDSQHIVPAGMALLIVRDADVDLDTLPEEYIVIDGTCVHAPNAPGKLPMGVGIYPIAPGAHTLGVVTSPRGSGLVDCKGKRAKSTTPLTVQAGRRYLALMYGLPDEGFKVVAAPIDPK
jgi:hypothetical protein